jgi:hypothetical protein
LKKKHLTIWKPVRQNEISVYFHDDYNLSFCRKLSMTMVVRIARLLSWMATLLDTPMDNRAVSTVKARANGLRPSP